MPTRLAIRIQECLDDLTPSERNLGLWILEHQNQVVALSAAELARSAEVSKSTAVRFFRALGYDSFETVRLQARSELNQRQPGESMVIAPAQARAGSAQAFLSSEVTALARTLEALSSETLRAVVERLAAAERIWILAFDDDAPLAPLARAVLMAVRGNVQLLADGQTSPFSQIVSVGPRDTMLVIALGPRSAAARFMIEQAQAAGANLVTLTDIALPSPLGADLVVRCHARSGMPDGSVVAAVSVLQLIGRRLADRLGPRAASRKALLESVREAAKGRG